MRGIVLTLMPKSHFVRKNYFGRRLAYYYGFAFVCVFIIVGFFLKQNIEARLLKQVEKALYEQALILSKSFPSELLYGSRRQESQEKINAFAEGVEPRITIIAKNGFVLADSKRSWKELQKMGDHANRLEVKKAFAGEVGVSQRYSETLKEEMLFVAVPIFANGAVDGVVRLSLPRDEILIFLSEVKYPVWLGMSIGILFMFALSLYLGSRVSKRVSLISDAAQRFSKGHLDEQIEVRSDDEFDFLAVSLNRMASSLKKRISERETEKQKSAIILSAMSEGVIAVNNKKEILLVNESIGNFFNISSKDALGRNILHVTKSPSLDACTSRVIKSKSFECEELETSESGLKILKVDILGLEREDIAAILVFSDITQIKLTEKMRREFVANVSHELRTPLTSIRGFIETLLQGAISDPDASQRFLSIMDEDARRLERLIADVLVLSKLESNEEKLNLSPLFLKEVSDNVIERIRPQAEKRQITFSNKIENDAKVLADQDKLYQVFLNLIDNAIKFSREKGEIILRSKAEQGFIVIEIEDHGTGVPKDAIPHLFERFSRIDKARSRELGGTGLGLSIVKHILELHQGSISCESVYGHGATFKFRLPINLN
jgi:two-component system phosphate regulon sensor histidine kinase PhoR